MVFPGFVTLLSVMTLSAPSGHPDQTPRFHAAKPVWLEGRELEMNLTVGFRALFDAPEEGTVTLRVTAASIYRVFVNGAFCGHGPARGPRGHFRVDEWDLAQYLHPASNIVAIEVAGYNCNSYYLLDQPSFVQAEISAGDTVLAATGQEPRGFTARPMPERVQRAQRYSFQRPFAEV